jgi:cell division protein FtsL
MATSVAYDLSRFSDETPTQQKVRVASTKKNIRTEEDRKFLVRLVFLSVAVITLAVYTVYSNMLLTNVKSQITNRSSELVEIQSENIYLDYQIESLVSLRTAEEYAQSLGLIKMDSAQIEYVNLEKENKIVSEEPQINDRSAIAFLSTVIGWFNP